MRQGAIWLVLFILVPSSGGEIADQEARIGVSYNQVQPPWIGTGEYGWYDHADILDAGISVPETGSLKFWIQLSELDPDGADPAGGLLWTDYAIQFNYAEVNYTLLWKFAHRFTDVILNRDDGARSVTVDRWTGGLDAQENRRFVVIPWEAIVGAKGERVPSPAEFTGVFATARSMNAYTQGALTCVPSPISTTDGAHTVAACPLEVRDRFPDQGALVWQIPGADNNKSLDLRIPDPIRYTNGLETTYAFLLEIENKGPERDVYITVDGKPNDWRVELDASTKIAASTKGVVPLYVSVPFAHQHGSSGALNVSIKAGSDSDSEEVRIAWSEIPQPSGHHDTVYLHRVSDTQGESVWMNTLATDPAGIHPGLWSGTVTTDNSVSLASQTSPFLAVWEIALEPSLVLGLAADVALIGKATFDSSFQSEGPIIWNGELFILDALGHTTLFELPELQAEIGRTVLDVVPTAEAAHWPVPIGAELRLRLEATGELAAAATAITVATGESRAAIDTASFAMQLPLLEFHDRRIGASAEPIVDWDQRALQANPGDVILVKLTNVGNETADLRLRGEHVKQSKLESTELKPGETTHLLLRAPNVAMETWTPILEARTQTTFDAWLLQVTIFDSGLVDVPSDAQDASQVFEPSKRTSAPLLLVGIAMLAFVGLKRRTHPF